MEKINTDIKNIFKQLSVILWHQHTRHDSCVGKSIEEQRFSKSLIEGYDKLVDELSKNKREDIFCNCNYPVHKTSDNGAICCEICGNRIKE
jgi:hypothetical protein